MQGPNGQPRQRPSDAKPPFTNLDTKEWQVFLSRERDKRLGIDVDPRQRTHLLVLSIEEGTVDEYNAKNPENAVRPGDRIVAVNGSSQAPDMVHQFRNAPFLLITFRRTEAKVIEKKKLRLEDLTRRVSDSLRMPAAMPSLPSLSSMPTLPTISRQITSSFGLDGSGPGTASPEGNARPESTSGIREANGVH
jgi:hypothetical protein